jgi:hypothetical protein
VFFSAFVVLMIHFDDRPQTSITQKEVGEQSDSLNLNHTRCYHAGLIAIGLSVTSRGTDMKSASDSPAFRVLFPSFFSTASNSGHTYTFYVGFDKGDPLYDTEDGRAEFRAKFNQMSDEHDIVKPGLVMKAFVGTDHAPSWVICNLMQMAYNDGAEYLFQVNDDSQLVGSGWERAMAHVLATNPTWPNLGATGPTDTKWRNGLKGVYGNDGLLTHAFVHRTHLDIHGRFFPAAFKNWWSDNWITKVYGAKDTLFLKAADGVFVEHKVLSRGKTQVGFGIGLWLQVFFGGKQRYNVDKADKDKLPVELKKGRKRIQAWLAAGTTKPNGHRLARPCIERADR